MLLDLLDSPAEAGINPDVASAESGPIGIKIGGGDTGIMCGGVHLVTTPPPPINGPLRSLKNGSDLSSAESGIGLVVLLVTSAE